MFLLSLLWSHSAFAHPGGHDYGAVVSSEPVWTLSPEVVIGIGGGLLALAVLTRLAAPIRKGLIVVSAGLLVYGCITESASVDEDSGGFGEDSGWFDESDETGQTEEGCPSDIIDSFLDVTGFTAPGDAQPFLSVSCTEDAIIIQSNAIPNHETNDVRGDRTEAFAFTWTIPRSPEILDTSAVVEMERSAIGVATNGVPIMEPAAGPQDDRQDPIIGGLTDACNGHTDHNGVYHYHGVPVCLFDDAQPDAVAGWAFDGHRMVVPWTCEDEACETINELQSSWVYVGGAEAAWEANEYQSSAGDLDECNGQWVDGAYEYRMTLDFPYSVGCFTAERIDQVWNSPFDTPPAE